MAKFYYNDILLPDISSIASEYAYWTICPFSTSDAVRLYATNYPFVIRDNEYGNPDAFLQEDSRILYATCGVEGYGWDSWYWGSERDYTKDFIIDRTEVAWTNYDIVYESTGEIYLATSDPIPEDQYIGDSDIKEKKFLGVSGVKQLIYNTRSEISIAEQNVKNYADSVVANIGSSNPPTRTIRKVLFSNTNTNSYFAAQSININNLSNYDKIYIECASDTGTDGIGVVRNTIVFDNADTELHAIYATFFYNGVVTQLFRGVKISGNTIVITDCEMAQGSSVSISNQYMVPVKIIGTKYNVTSDEAEVLSAAEELMFE
jgi:hypothetical protein